MFSLFPRIGSASASANAYANAGTSAFSLSNAFTGIGSLPTVDGSHDGHKGIRSYDNTGYNGNNQPNGGVKGNQRGGCPKCKWEDDDYWEKDEDETEPEEKDEDDCDDGDDGQYREHGHYHGHKNKGGSPPGVQKLGVPNSNGQGPHTGVSAASNAASSGSGTPFGTTPVKGGRPETGSSSSGSPWNKAFPVTGQQPGSGWNTGSGTTPKPAWNQGFGDSPGTASHPSNNWNSGRVPNADVSSPTSDGSWNGGPKTGFGCSGNYQHGTGCAQG